MEKILDIFRDLFQTIRDINEKYKTPEIEMTPTVRISLLVLRIYLLATVGIIFIKLVTLVIAH